jgi:hypothetical protein
MLLKGAEMRALRIREFVEMLEKREKDHGPRKARYPSN